MSQRPSNQILAALPLKTYELLSPALERFDLRYGEVIYETGALIEHVYFPESGIISLLSAVDERATVEVGVVGSEGMAGLQLYLDEDRSNTRAVVQGVGVALKMEAGAFRRECQRDDHLPLQLRRFTNSLMSQISQSAACNRYHRIDARLARWLLMTHDRMRSDTFRITHEFLSNMLGIRREAVSRAAFGLQKAGLISYHRGELTIHDRKAVEAAAYACYKTLALGLAG